MCVFNMYVNNTNPRTTHQSSWCSFERRQHPLRLLIWEDSIYSLHIYVCACVCFLYIRSGFSTSRFVHCNMLMSLPAGPQFPSLTFFIYINTPPCSRVLFPLDVRSVFLMLILLLTNLRLSAIFLKTS